MKNRVKGVAWIAAIGIGLGVTSPVMAHGNDEAPTRTIAEILLSDSAKDDAEGFDHRWNDFDIVTQAVLLFPDLVSAASNPDLDLTVFLPNDRAFRKLVQDLTGQRLNTESEVFGAVAGLGLDTVKTVLTYHIIVGSAIDYRSARQSDGAALTTLQGGTLTVDVRGHHWNRIVKLVDNDPDDRNATVVWPNVGGEATNGFAHGIDRVLRPIDL
jgi:uncharacterized surface protein with fasciclin (FAS1) repeats